MEALNTEKAPEMSKRSELIVRDALHCTGLELCLVAYSIIGDSASSSRKLVRKKVMEVSSGAFSPLQRVSPVVGSARSC